MAVNISRLLGLGEFTLTNQAKWQKQGGHSEAKIMALIIVAAKIGFDLENNSSWGEWAVATDEDLQRERLARNDDIAPDEILEMSDERLDEYMDWLQSTWIDEDYNRLNSKTPG
jgi:hypothetical protein